MAVTLCLVTAVLSGYAPTLAEDKASDKARRDTAMPAGEKMPAANAETPQGDDLSVRLKNHVEMLAAKIGARSITGSQPGLEKAADYVFARLKEYGLKPQSQSFAVKGATGQKGGSCRNIVATLAGSMKDAGTVVVGAHYDAVDRCPGADDNATGVAALLELAKALSKHKLSKSVVVVAFANEEPPFFKTEEMGSFKYAKGCHDRHEKITAMLSLETLGYYTDKPNTQKYPEGLEKYYPSTGNFVAFVADMKSAYLMSNCVSAFKRASDFPCEALAAAPGVEGVDFSDQQSFWRFGYPGVMVTDTAFLRYPYYHSDQDTVDKVDFEKLAKVVTGLIATVSEISK